MRATATRYSGEVREWATRMAVELRRDPVTEVGALERVAAQLGMHPMTLRKWVRQAEVDGGVRSGTTSIEAERVARLEAENRELRRANEILRTASAFSRPRSSTAD